MKDFKAPYITIVIPLFNNGKSIKRTLNSLINQSLSKWDCLIIDDGSEDESIAIVTELIKGDDRFSFFQRQSFSEKKGANICRNIGLKKVKSKYVLFLDADDTLSRGCLENRMQALENRWHHFDFLVFKTAFVNKKGEITGFFVLSDYDQQNIISRFFSHDIPWHTMSPVWNVTFLKEIGGWNEEYERLQDVELSVRALLAKPNVFFEVNNSVDSYYYINKMSPDKIKAARMGFCRLVKDYYLRVMDDKRIKREYKKKMYEMCQYTLESQFLTYIRQMKKDENWEELYIDTLEVLNVCIEDQNSIKNIFKKI